MTKETYLYHKRDAHVMTKKTYVYDKRDVYVHHLY